MAATIDTTLARNMLRWMMFAQFPTGAGASSDSYVGILDDNGDELTGGGYARVSVSSTWAAPSYSYSTGSDIVFTNLPAVTVQFIAFFAGSNPGTTPDPMLTVEITPIVLTAGDDVTIPDDDLTVTFTPTGDLTTLDDGYGHPRQILEITDYPGLPGQAKFRSFDMLDAGVEVTDRVPLPVVVYDSTPSVAPDDIADNWDDPSSGATFNIEKFWYYNSNGVSVDGWRLNDGFGPTIVGDIATPFNSNPTDSIQVDIGDFTASITGAP